MNNMKINIPEGFEIDKENSSLETGDIVFKKVEKKYPDVFIIPKTIYYNEMTLSEKYARKLDILDTLLCLRDEYNIIDGFTDGFSFDKKNWCISNYCNTLNISCWTLRMVLCTSEKKKPQNFS